MGYFVLIVLFIVIIGWVEKRTFRWQTVLRYLWKQIYLKADQMASHMKQFNIKSSEDSSLERFKAQIEFSGKLINSILDYVNLIENERADEDSEEETFGYGRYNFDTVFYMATTHPDHFKKFK